VVSRSELREGVVAERQSPPARLATVDAPGNESNKYGEADDV